MANALHIPLVAGDELSVEEQIEQQRAPIPAWHMEMLKERHAEFEANPNDCQPWDEFEVELRAELASRRR